jgi:hypothetical protein
MRNPSTIVKPDSAAPWNAPMLDYARINAPDPIRITVAALSGCGALFVLTIEILSSLGQGHGSVPKGPQCSPESFA